MTATSPNSMKMIPPTVLRGSRTAVDLGDDADRDRGDGDEEEPGDLQAGLPVHETGDRVPVAEAQGPPEVFTGGMSGRGPVKVAVVG